MYDVPCKKADQEAGWLAVLLVVAAIYGFWAQYQMHEAHKEWLVKHPSQSSAQTK